MIKNSQVSLLIFCLLFGFFSPAQNRQESEHRIKKAQFPIEAMQIVAENNKDFKRLKFYKEVDSITKTYSAKFKKDRLFYEMNFNQAGELNGLGFAVKPVDIPEESFNRITEFLSNKFEKSKIRRMSQIYLVKANEGVEKTIQNAFQNMMLPNIIYELFVKGKKEGTRTSLEITFDAEGNLIQLKKALPTNHDRVLY